MSKAILYDLYSGAGGAAKGYMDAGFTVIGIDNVDQPRYCGDEFIKMDAIEFLSAVLRGEYPLPDAFHASPPCGRYAGVTAWRGNKLSHPDLIKPTQNLLRLTGKFYIIENVDDARGLLEAPVMLCGTMFGLNVQSHRWFETNFPIIFHTPALCQHDIRNVSRDHGKKYPESVLRDALGCYWMTVHEAREALPPCYTELIGRELMKELSHAVVR